MLYHPTVEKLQELRLMGMHAGLIEAAGPDRYRGAELR